ncbi:MAG TPA: hypothetical protein VGY31_11740 [Terriglobia bacterium]|nr:hypothetical protein [Terriglobia bacterium]
MACLSLDLLPYFSFFMFNLRKEQLKIFETIAAKEYEERALAQLREHSPAQCAALGESALVEIVHYGTGKAKAYGIVAEPDVCKYLGIMLQLGKDFDCNPRYPWAARTLNDASLGDPSARVNRLAAEALEAVAALGAKRAGSGGETTG